MKALGLCVFNLYKIIQSSHVSVSIELFDQTKAPVRGKLSVANYKCDMCTSCA